ncbi:hypothetical protein BN946_scf185004.g7 [Trametes cinnabarina]|uniref:Transposase family Tnp2 protein n=1 Tax=Pycnoporus cinnabarinus TaxID=5643 RepID=A0A060SK46_PYCCI|nr:hypothetical protein BN946_scf185004.g7 [Trametes cinnabarina]
MAEKMLYHVKEHKHTAGVIKDVMDSERYHTLLKERVTVGSQVLNHKFFEDPHDVVLGLSTDGFAPFRRRTQTAWPIVLFNYNLPPEICFHLEYVLSVGVVPGPKKPHDMDSFLWPLIQELHRLAIGVHAYDALSDEFSALRAYLLLVFGDIPAISMVMCMKGHNALSPCRMCKIRGVRIPGSSNPIHYVPLCRPHHPDADADPAFVEVYDPAHLPLRTHGEFLRQAEEVQMAPSEAKAARLAKQYGIKSIPLLSTLSSLSFPVSFPYDFMHLIWENVVKNLMQLWTSQYKDLNTGVEDYEVNPTVWEAVGEASAASGDTIPGIFGPHPPNVTSDKMSWTAETRSFWFQYLGPILLAGRFTHRKYYTHFVLLVRLLCKCLQFELSADDLAEICAGFIAWVEEYERYFIRIYYQHDLQRLSACPVTVHALLHITDSIEATGPVWASWAFPMESLRINFVLGPHIHQLASRYPDYQIIHVYLFLHVTHSH